MEVTVVADNGSPRADHEWHRWHETMTIGGQLMAPHHDRVCPQQSGPPLLHSHTHGLGHKMARNSLFLLFIVPVFTAIPFGLQELHYTIAIDLVPQQTRAQIGCRLCRRLTPTRGAHALQWGRGEDTIEIVSTIGNR